MLRISTVPATAGRHRLKIEGRLTRAVGGELRRAARAALKGGRVELDVADVTFVDHSGARLLRTLQHAGVALVGASAFVLALMDREQPVAAPPDTESGSAIGTEILPGRPADEQSGGRDESLLIARLRDGDERAYEELVRTHGGRLLAVCRRMLRNEEDARDAVQQTFLSAFRALATFHGTSRIATWLHRIAVNTALMKLRSRSRRPEDPIEELLPRFREDGHHAETWSDFGAPADVLLEQREVRGRVRAAIDRLPESYRTVLLLRDIEELDTVATAELLGVSANAVKIKLHRARQALARLLAAQFRSV